MNLCCSFQSQKLALSSLGLLFLLMLNPITGKALDPQTGRMPSKISQNQNQTDEQKAKSSDEQKSEKKTEDKAKKSEVPESVGITPVPGKKGLPGFSSPKGKQEQ